MINNQIGARNGLGLQVVLGPRLGVKKALFGTQNTCQNGQFWGLFCVSGLPALVSGVPVSRCPGVPVSRCPGVPVSRCPVSGVSRRDLKSSKSSRLNEALPRRPRAWSSVNLPLFSPNLLFPIVKLFSIVMFLHLRHSEKRLTLCSENLMRSNLNQYDVSTSCPKTSQNATWIGRIAPPPRHSGPNLYSRPSGGGVILRRSTVYLLLNNAMV